MKLSAPRTGSHPALAAGRRPRCAEFILRAQGIDVATMVTG